MIIPGLCSDPSQSDPETKDFWLNMAALTEALQRQAEQNPAASYYNVVLLRYQVRRGAGMGRGSRDGLRAGQGEQAEDVQARVKRAEGAGGGGRQWGGRPPISAGGTIM